MSASEVAASLNAGRSQNEYRGSTAALGDTLSFDKGLAANQPNIKLNAGQATN